MKEPGNFAEAAAVERGGWAAEDSDEEKPWKQNSSQDFSSE